MVIQLRPWRCGDAWRWLLLWLYTSCWCEGVSEGGSNGDEAGTVALMLLVVVVVMLEESVTVTRLVLT